MQRRETPSWIIFGGFTLALIGGCINAIGFLSIHHQAVSHMSGTVTVVGLDLARHDAAATIHTLGVLLAFFFGAFLSGFIIRQSALQLGRRYGVVLTVEALLLFAAMHALRAGLPPGIFLTAMACGLQNAMATSYSGAIVRTTHVTGIVTDLGIACGHLLRGQPIEVRRLQLYGVLLSGFTLGAYLGAVGYSKLSYNVLLFPSLLAGITGISYGIYKHLERHRHATSAHTP